MIIQKTKISGLVEMFKSQAIAYSSKTIRVISMDIRVSLNQGMWTGKGNLESNPETVSTLAIPLVTFLSPWCVLNVFQIVNLDIFDYICK